jgi:hypothetical protein
MEKKNIILLISPPPGDLGGVDEKYKALIYI